MTEIRELWKEHSAAPFPPRAYESDLDLVSLDSSASGVISTFLDESSPLNSTSVTVLERCAEQLVPAIDGFDSAERDYFGRLLRMIQTVHTALTKSSA